MGDKGDPAGTAVGAAAHSAGDDRAEAVGPDGETGPDRAAPALVIADHGPADGTSFIEQLLDRGAFRDASAGRASEVYQGVVQDSAGDRKSGRAERPRPGERKHAMRGRALNSGHLHAFERDGTRPLEWLDNSEAVQNPYRFRAHVLGAGLVAGKGGAVERQHRKTFPGQQGCAGA